MFNKIDQKFFIGSFLVHLTFIVLLLCFNLSNSINKKFVVYGAHSKKPTNAYFKPSRQTNKSNWLNNDNRLNRTKKLAQNSSSSSTKNLSKNKKSPIKELSGKSEKKRSIKIKNKISKNKSFKSKNSKQKSPTSMEEEPKKQIKNKKIKNKAKQTEKNKKKKKEPEKKIEEKKQEEIKTEEKKQKLEEPKEIETKEEPQVEPAKSEEVIELSETQNSEEPEELNFDLMGEQDPKLVIYQKLIQKEVDRLWHPPIGVPKGTESTLCFTLDSDGNVSNYEVLKKSDVLIYDLSIFRVAKSLKFDKSLWNKKFTVRFRQ